jgi:steroid delta-isomerase-like uncharacterized protein
MSLEENKAIARRFIEAYNKQDLDALDEFFAPDYVDHIQQIRDLESLKKTYADLYSGFPDTHSTIEDIIAEGDTVCLRYTNTGTHTSEYQGLAPTGKKFETASVEIYRIVDGKIVEGWTFLDWFSHLDFYKQIGIVEYKGFPDEAP